MRKLNVLALIVFTILAASCKKKETSPKLERELCDAAYKLNVDKAKQLVDRGVNVNTTVYEGHTPLSLAILGGVPDYGESASEIQNTARLLMVRLLIDSGADVNTTTLIKNRSPLDFARLVDDDKLLEEMLTKAGAKPHITEETRMPKSGMASVAKLDYLFKAKEAAEKSMEEEKRKIVEGKK